MTSRIKRSLIIPSMLIVLQLIFSIAAQARPSYQPQVKPLEGCHTCHENQGGGGVMNSFGQDWVSNGKKYSKIAKLDSDGDGFTNEEELKDKTFPGDPSSNRDSRFPYLLVFGVVLVLTIAGVTLWKAAVKAREKEQNNK